MKPIAKWLVFSCLITSFALASVLSGQSNTDGTPSVSTPHTPDGKPDLTGMWQNKVPKVSGSPLVFENKDENGNYRQRFASRRCGPTQKGIDGTGCFEETNQTIDGEFTHRFDPNRPLYKPEYWDKVQDLDYNTNTKDPIFECQPMGVPRMGAPTQIVQTPKYVTFFYTGAQEADQFRIIPIDGRGHDSLRAKDISYFGDAIGRWDGDTLVVESVGFNDITWIASGIYGHGGGYFHSYDMRVTERLRRDGNTLHYQATVEDPTVLLQPWVMDAKELELNADPKAYVREGDQCSQSDEQIVTRKIRQ